MMICKNVPLNKMISVLLHIHLWYQLNGHYINLLALSLKLFQVVTANWRLWKHTTVTSKNVWGISKGQFWVKIWELLLYIINLWLFLTFFGSFSGGYGQFAALKTYNRDLKTLIAIGGWNEGSRRFSPLVADASRRKTFIRSALRFLR